MLTKAKVNSVSQLIERELVNIAYRVKRNKADRILPRRYRQTWAIWLRLDCLNSSIQMGKSPLLRTPVVTQGALAASQCRRQAGWVKVSGIDQYRSNQSDWPRVKGHKDTKGEPKWL